MFKLNRYRKLIIVLYCVLIGNTLCGQSPTTAQKDSSAYASINRLLSRVVQKNNVQFFFNAEWFHEKKFPIALSDLPLEECLIRIKRLTGYSCLTMGEGEYVFVPSDVIMSAET